MKWEAKSLDCVAVLAKSWLCPKKEATTCTKIKRKCHVRVVKPLKLGGQPTNRDDMSIGNIARLGFLDEPFYLYN